MVKIKEIRKIESNIKEIKKEKVESLDDEVDSEEIGESFVGFGSRRFVGSSTLDSSETPQTVEARQRTIEKEDREEINFRPSYTGNSNPYQNNSYTPVGSAESNSEGRSLGERDLDRGRELRNDSSERRSGEVSGDRAYAGEKERKGERKNL